MAAVVTPLALLHDVAHGSAPRAFQPFAPFGAELPAFLREQLVTNDAYAAHVAELLSLSSSADAALRRHQVTARQADERGSAALSAELELLAQFSARLQVARRRAAAAGVGSGGSTPVNGVTGSDPASLLRLLLARAEAAIADVEHTQRVLAAEREREREQRRDREREAATAARAGPRRSRLNWSVARALVRASASPRSPASSSRF